MGYGRCKLNVTHALAAYFSSRDLDAALVAYDALVPYALISAAVALPVLRRSKYSFAEQAVLFGLKRSVVNRLGLFNLAVRPLEYLLGRSKSYLYSIEIGEFKQCVPLPSVVTLTLYPECQEQKIRQDQAQDHRRHHHRRRHRIHRIRRNRRPLARDACRGRPPARRC